jgi:hypothetical protein
VTLVIEGLKSGFRAWRWSLGVLVRSPLYVVGLALLLAVWGWAGYEWLALPESSTLVLLLALVWLLALAVLAIAMLAGTSGAAADLVARGEERLRLRWLVSFARRRFLRSTLILALAVVLILALGAVLGWVNDHALHVASFLTFHGQTPVSYVLVGKILWVIEVLICIALGGALMEWLLRLTARPHRPNLARSSKRASIGVAFLTGVLSVGVFGGLVWWLASWHPSVKAGGWDYAQLSVRTGAALLFLSIGWLFWTLALAHLALVRVNEEAILPPPPAAT